MNKRLKKNLIYGTAALGIAVVLSCIYIFSSSLLDSFDNRLRDFLFKVRGNIDTTQNVIIVDIDEKSLKHLGQWPWSRNKIATVLENLVNNEAAIIGFDVVFAEVDNSSPHRVFETFNVKKDNVPNYDAILAQTIGQTPTILGYLFELEDKPHINKTAPNIPGIIINKRNDYLIEAHGTILNTQLIQNSAYSSGFFNNIPDDSGIIRSVPLVINYDNSNYTSLALEIMRIITQTQTVRVNSDDDGIYSVTLKDIEIPTDRHGRMQVNFRGGRNSFEYYSALDIYNNTIDKEKIKNKIVLIGTSAVGLLDLRAMPFDSVYPGVEVHANIIDNIIAGDFISKDAWIDGFNIPLIFLLSFIIVYLIKKAPFSFNPIISIVFLIAVVYGAYILMFDYGIVVNIIFPLLTVVLSSIIATMLDYFYEIKQEEAIKKKFASKVSQGVMENLLQNIDDQTFQAEEKEITVFFSDIRSFTNISEQMGSAKDLIDFLNEYMDPMSNIITEYEGTIDKYIGDAIMAYWNAPANVQNHADKALQASLKQLRSLKQLNEKLKETNQPYIDIGIGLNTGLAVVGEMGSQGRSDYTVIGDSVNLGARLESLCKYYNSKINISNFVKAQLKEEYIFRFLDLVTVKGKAEPIEIWQVIEEETEHLREELEHYHKAVELYQQGLFKEALVLFEEGENNPYKSNQNVYTMYIQRCQEYIKYPPENFNGVYEHTTKG
jgi:adenylate cyclase